MVFQFKFIIKLTFDFPVEPEIKYPRVEIPLGWSIKKIMKN